MSKEKTPLLNARSNNAGSVNACVAPQNQQTKLCQPNNYTTQSNSQATLRFGYFSFDVMYEHPERVSISEGNITCGGCRERYHLNDTPAFYNQHVAKCPSCNECTPIRRAPPGKKFIRCKCQCLLICSQRSLKINCPRISCKRVIDLSMPTLADLVPPTVPGVQRVGCGYCYDVFLFNVKVASHAQCPHCERFSSIGNKYKRCKALQFILLGLAVALGAIGVLVGTHYVPSMKRDNRWIILYVLLFIVSAPLLSRGVHYIRMKVSQTDLLA